MIKNYIKIAWRNFYKHKFYTLINVFGLAMGIGCGIILFIFISYHLSFDNYHPNSKQVYRIVTDMHLPDGVEYDQGAPLVLGRVLKRQQPAILKEAIFLNKRSFAVTIKQNNNGKESYFYENENIAFANNDLFSIFSGNWLAGDANTALTEPNTAVITSALAKKYFNTDDVIGKIITLDNKFNITITGILQNNRKNTDMQADLYISLPSVKAMYDKLEISHLYNDWEWISSKNMVFVLLNSQTMTSAMNNRIATLTAKTIKTDAKVFQFHLQPLADIHFNTLYGGTITKPLLTILALIGLALILIAGVNFVNMATAQSLTRAKEIGTRKVLGSSRSGIFWQFMMETAYVAISAAIVALFITWCFLPVLNNWLQLPLTINNNVFVFLVMLLVMFVFFAGFYPAVILSGFKPVNALKNIIDQSKPASRLSRNVLIVLQNSIAQLLIVCTLIITLQVKFLKSVDMGFNKDAIIMVPLPHSDSITATLPYVRNQLKNYSGIKNVSFCYNAPTALHGKGGSVKYDGSDWENFSARSVIGDENYLKTFELRLLAGRNISTIDTATEYVVNQQLLSKLNIKLPEQAIGHTLVAGDFNDKRGTIVGVVKDFNTGPLYSRIEPAIIAIQPAYYQYAAIKIAGGKQMDIINYIKQTWQKAYPQNAFEYQFLDQEIANFYQKEEMISKLIKTGTVVGILISCLGMLGLISLMTVQRTKEIGIRKVLGASVAQISVLLSKEFLAMVSIALIVSLPIAWWAMHKWLENFAYRINVQWWVFALTGIAALLIAILTVSIQAIKAATANPVESLRSE